MAPTPPARLQWLAETLRVIERLILDWESINFSLMSLLVARRVIRRAVRLN